MAYAEGPRGATPTVTLGIAYTDGLLSLAEGSGAVPVVIR
jgi:hypothetical protein